MKKRIVIIGGGIAGLSTAYFIRDAAGAKNPDIELVILESKDRLGGNIRTEKKDGFLIEGGPDCFLSEKPWAMALCRKLGIESEFLPTNEENKKTFVLSRGKLHELPEGFILMVPTRIIPFMTNSLISLPGKMRMGLEYFIPKRKDSTDETLGDFVRRRLGKEALDKIAEPLVAGVHAGDPETMSVRASFPKFVQMEEDYGSLIKGMLARLSAMRGAKAKGDGATDKKRVTMFMTLANGLSTLIDALVSSLQRHPETFLRVNTPVKGVNEWKEKKKYIVSTDFENIEADALIIAAPAHAASALLSKTDKELSDALLTIPYVSTATVSIGFKKKDIKHPLNGFGFVVPRVEGRKIMAATWTSVKFAHRAPADCVLMRCFVGGSKNAELVDLNDDELLNMVRSELREIMGIDANPVISRVYRWRKSMPQYTVGHEERVTEIETKTAKHPGLFLTGSAYRGIGISDSIKLSEAIAKSAVEYLK